MGNYLLINSKPPSLFCSMIWQMPYTAYTEVEIKVVTSVIIKQLYRRGLVLIASTIPIKRLTLLLS